MCDADFAKLKRALITAPVLVPPDLAKSFRCRVEASQREFGGTLTQLDDNNHERVIPCYSRKLSEVEDDYTANEREILGLVYCIKRFR